MTEKERLRNANAIMMMCIEDMCEYDFNRRPNESVESWNQRIVMKAIDLQLTAEQCKQSLVEMMCCERK
jgi:hypothetical protein